MECIVVKLIETKLFLATSFWFQRRILLNSVICNNCKNIQILLEKIDVTSKLIISLLSSSESWCLDIDFDWLKDIINFYGCL